MAVRLPLLLCGLLLLALPCAGQQPRIRHDDLDSRTLRLSQEMDKAALAADPDCRPLDDNTDRVHLVVTFSSTRSMKVSLEAPANWSEQRLTETFQAIMTGLGRHLRAMTISPHDESRVATALFGSVAQRQGRRYAASINWPGALAALRTAQVSLVEIRLRAQVGKSITATACGLDWKRTECLAHPMLLAVISPSAPVMPMALTYGYTPGEIRRIWILLGALVILPFALLLALRAWVMGRPGDNGAYQAYARLRRWVPLLTFPLWPFALLRLGGVDLISFALPPTARGARTALLLLITLGLPLAVTVCASVWSYPVEQQFRGILYSRRAYLLRSALPFALLALPMILMFLGFLFAPDATLRILSGTDGQHGLLGTPAVFIVVAGVITFLARVGTIQAMKPQPLEQGELVERILALGRQANVHVAQVFLAQTQRDRVANAMVTSGGTVLLTDYLVRRFTREEVDGVIAHELAHLRLRHHARRRIAQGIGIVLWLATAYGLRKLFPAWGNDTIYWTFVFVPPLVQHFVSRRHELEADAEAVRITGNPYAYIRMLKKLASLNGQPLRGGRIAEATGTHPGSERRIRAIAQRCGVGDAQVQMLLGEADASLQTESFAPPELAFDLPAYPTLGPLSTSPGYALTESDGKRLFTAQRRARHSLRSALPVFLAFPACMALTLLLLHVFAPKGTGLLAALIAIPGIAISFGVLFIGGRLIGFASMRRMRPELEAKVAAEYDVDLKDAAYVGVSPGAEVRSYGGDTSWDFGFLRLEPGRIRYLGDATAFELRADQIERTEIRAHRYTLSGAFRRLYVTWRETPEAVPQVFSIEMRDARSFADLRRLTERLQEDVERLRRESIPTLPSVVALGLPPSADKIIGKPLPANAQAGVPVTLGAFVVSIACMAGVMFLAARLFGKTILDDPLWKYGPIFGAIWLNRVLVVQFQKRRR